MQYLGEGLGGVRDTSGIVPWRGQYLKADWEEGLAGRGHSTNKMKKRDGRGHEDSHQQHVEVERDAQETESWESSLCLPFPEHTNRANEFTSCASVLLPVKRGLCSSP